MNALEQARAIGQSFWLDYIRKDLIESGELEQLVSAGLLQGMTSNPTIFEQSISKSDLYTASLRPLAQAGWTTEQIFDALTLDDIRGAADVFRPVYEAASGGDGYVSIEVSPLLADDTQASLDEARRLWAAVNRPNVMVKIPATRAGLPAIEAATADGINVNITLIFSLARHAEVMEAYLRGLETRAERGASLDHIFSVASFFVSRVDTLVDSLLERLVKEEGPAAERAASLLGKAAIANARLAYAQYQAVFHGPRFEALRAKGANVQRPLWASTSTKNPDYRDTVYVDNLIAAETVNTLPRATLEAFRDHGDASATLDAGLSEARAQLEALASLGVSMEAVTDQLEREGVAKFSESFEALKKSIATQAEKLEAEIPGLQAPLRETLKRFDQEEVGRRLWAEDPNLWPTGEDPASERLGWLSLPQRSVASIEPITSFAAKIRAEGVTDVLLLGMGGSSLAPAVMERMGWGDGGLRFQVLDTTEPSAVHDAVRERPPQTTLVLVASKSGTTIEPMSLMEIFWERAQRAMGEAAGTRFAAITDSGTPLEAQARRRGFSAVFTSPSDVGGRYAALTEFGLVPAGLMGVDLQALLEGGARMARASSPNAPSARNPGLFLGALLAAAASLGRDKLTFVADEDMQPLPAWIEQLIAESSGKDGKGLFPVAGEPPAGADAYGADRLMIYLRSTGEHDRRAQTWARQGVPVVVLQTGSQPEAVGAEFFRWEIATAAVCHALGVNAFDQPDVQRAKDQARAALRSRKRDSVPQGNVAWSQQGIEVWAHHLFPDGTTLRAVWETVLAQLTEREAVVLLSYLPERPTVEKPLVRLRRLIRDRTRAATMLGFGPRYLHSTGQLFKGGPDRLLAVYLIGPVSDTVVIPGDELPLGILQRAQAVGDFEAMHAAGRRAYAFVLSSPSELDVLEKALRDALAQRAGSAA
ncbi:MAG TPA: bifunctional transaldolase/phosoglucose isomerase [Anaerolineales bacterium]|nr:bifunctional transaldolase/phosoglucose isomerase [Anaerolineales bacterium]